MDSTKVFSELKLDLKSLLLDVKKEHLEKLLDNAIEAKVARMNQREIKGFLVGMLLKPENFSIEDIVEALEFPGTEISLSSLLEEPSSEEEMKKPVISEYPGDKFKSATEVQLPAEKKSKSARIDVAILRKGLLGSNLTAFELKLSSQRGEILKAFSQAQAYLEFCDEACVAISPIVYVKQYELVRSQMDEHKKIGVWVVNKRKKLAEIRPIPYVGIENKGKKEVIRFIEGDSVSKK
ncbi:MAG TPA: hypothetical protein VGK23_09065 [Methanomassiliicoccales archaeon]